MFKVLACWVMGVFFCFSAQATPAPDWLQKVDAKIKQLQSQSIIKKNHWALWLQRLSDSKTIHQHNHDQLFIPASVTKLFAGGGFLEHLPLYFNTELWAVGPVEDRILKGNLYLKGGGDAGFVSESMWALVRTLARTRLQKIEGHVVVDDTLFPAKQSRFPAQGKAYSAPISSMLFNWSVANVYVRGAKAVGALAWVTVDPGPTSVRIINKATTGQRTRGLVVRRISKARNLSSSEVKNHCTRDEIEVLGQISRHSKERLFYRSLTRPSCWSAFNLIDFLKFYNIQVQNKVQLDKVPMRARLLAEHKSEPLPDQVKKMMRFSNNTMTEVLYQHLKQHFAKKPAREPSTINKNNTRVEGPLVPLHISSAGELAQYIRSTGVNEFQLDSVSGLSRKNKFKAVDVGRYLLRMREHPLVGVDFMASLPVSGGPGTLEKRLVSSYTKGRVRAKTGMLNGVAALAGFARHPVQGELAFVYFFNGPAAQTEKAKIFIDNILEQVLKM